ncbi:hypothetical protein M378DRAFT_172722, partial [Amanita muscaria Koide BX008]
MFRNYLLGRRSNKKKEETAPSAVNERVSTRASSLTAILFSGFRSHIGNQRSQSPMSQSTVPASTRSGSESSHVFTGIDTHVIEFGSNADFAGATAIAFGAHSTATNNSYHIRLGDQVLTETKVEEFMAGLLALPDKMEKMAALSTDLPRAMAAHNDYMPQKEHEPCFNGTREALLKEIGSWLIIIGTSQIHVLSGLAGIGKSTIAYTVAQRADRLGLLGASFFFSRKEAERRTAEKFFTTIAFQLCVYDVQFARAIERAISMNQGKSATTKDPETQLNVLIIEPLRDIVRSRTQPVVIVVDALDECEDKDAQVILNALSQLVHEIPSFKILLTTRPQPHLDHLLGSHDVFYLHNVEEKIIENDIRSYLKFSLSMEQVKSVLPTLRTPWNATDDDIDALVQAAGKLFIIASTSVFVILDKAVRNPSSQMKKLRSELARNHTPFIALGDFYSIILRAVIPPGSDRVLMVRFRKVVGTIVLLYDPLPVQALAHLIGIEEDDIYGVLDNLRSVIILGTNDIPFIYHKSFSDWIMDQDGKGEDHRIDPRDGHTFLTICCLQTMNKRLKRNILNIRGVLQFVTSSEALKRKRIKKRMLKKISSVLRYACVYWSRHITEANVDDSDLIDQVRTFADEHLPHWIEVVGWISSETTFSLNLQHVEQSMRNTTLHDFRELLSDGHRFLSKFIAHIGSSALFTYHSALPFTPTESMFYRKYKREMMHNICRVSGGSKTWDAVIASPIHGPRVDRIVFSEHGEFVSCSASDIKFWNSSTGTCSTIVSGDRLATSENLNIAFESENDIYMYEHKTKSSFHVVNFPEPIVSITLSSTRHRLAATFSGGLVVLWALDVSKLITGFGGFASDSRSSHEPCHLAFSPNGDRLAYRLVDGGVALRNGIDGEQIADLEYNSAMVHHLVFSPDGSRLASVVVEDDHKHTLTLWDCTDGTFLGAAPDVGPEVAFSADGTLIVAGGRSSAAKLWRVNNEDQGLHFIETPDLSSLESISCLAFSQNDMLAIATADTGIKLYDVANSSFIATIPFQKPTAVAFSHDCTRLAAGNEDGVLRLLDIPSAHTSQENSAHISALVFSPDCSRLVSGSEDGIIRIWNTSCASEPIASYEAHLSKITTLAFTPNGSQFVSGDANRTIIFWCTNDCAISNAIRWLIAGELISVAVSNDLLAAATEDTIILWDRQRSCIIDRLGECGSMLLSLSNHDENLLLASFNSHSNSVTVWDVQSRTPCATFSVGK